MLVAAESPKLKIAIERHLALTAVHIERLTKTAEKVGVRPSDQLCKEAKGLTDEVEDLGQLPLGPVRDIAIIYSAQKIEHYEICSFGTLIEWARQLEFKGALPLLERTLLDEKETDALLSDLATASINVLAPVRESSAIPSTRRLVDFKASVQ
jgi:ferritin-like metal-binding protein YciE